MVKMKTCNAYVSSDLCTASVGNRKKMGCLGEKLPSFPPSLDRTLDNRVTPLGHSL